MSWLSSFINHNRDFAGNALKNVSPLAFLIPGIGPAAAAGLGAAGSALGRGIQHGSNFGNIVKQGAQGGAMAYGGAQGMNALKTAFAPSSSAAATIPGVASPIPGAAGSMQGPGSAALNLMGHAPPPPSMLDQIGGALGGAARGAGSFIKANPTAVGAGLQGLGQMGAMGSENRLRNAQADQIGSQAQMTQAELQMMKQRQAALAPLLQALMGQQSQGSAPNPYAGQYGTRP